MKKFNYTSLLAKADWMPILGVTVLSIIILSIIAIQMLIIALGVKISSPGPVFFRQKRYGIHGEEMRVCKFRTMKVCEDGEKVIQAMAAAFEQSPAEELPERLLRALEAGQAAGGDRPAISPSSRRTRSRTAAIVAA